MITLLTDFGTQDEYVGVCKGVILSINPGAVIVDLTHGVPPQDVLAAALTLKYAYDYFPVETLHVCIVDPGVGSSRSILAARAGGHLFLAPDNGLLMPILMQHAQLDIVAVEKNDLFKDYISGTFHGRDIFSPVAGHLSKGYPLTELGRRLHLDDLCRLPHAEPTLHSDGSVEGVVVSVDRFGNLITNIEKKFLSGLIQSAAGRPVLVQVGARTIKGLCHHYAESQKGRLLGLIGSRNCLEIAANQASAAVMTGAGVGQRVIVCNEKPGAEREGETPK